MKRQVDMNQELAHCLSAIAKGDEGAFERLYKLSSPKLNAIILGMIKDEALTFDILQQAYIAIWKNAGKFDASKGKSFTWMLVITRNKAFDMIRKRKKFSLSEEISDDLTDEKMQSDLGAKSLLLRRLIAPHMACLTPNMRDAVILSTIYGMTSREIGEKFGVPTNTAKSWTRRGLARLQAKMGVEDLNVLL